MIDFYTAQVRRHRQNLERYSRILATELTDLERQYLHKRRDFLEAATWPNNWERGAMVPIVFQKRRGRGPFASMPSLAGRAQQGGGERPAKKLDGLARDPCECGPDG